jgi:PKD repeat protein
MDRSLRARPAVIAATLCLALVAGCTVKQQGAPDPSGPSALGTDLTIQADPDTLNQDGASQSVIAIQARDGSNQPIRNLSMRVETSVNGVLADFGRLSARTLVTGSDGRATLVYTSPPAPAEPVDTFTIVTLLVTPIGTDQATAVPRSVNIRLVPPGVILPPNGTPLPSFTFSQPAQEGTPIQFDASSSRDDGQIVSYRWDFGDRSAQASGVRVTHTYAQGGTYGVTLTVTDDRSLSASTTSFVSVSASANPVASFTASPGSPGVNESVFFNAAASQAATGRTIVNFDWTFGDGGRGGGRTTSHAYAAAGNYTVTLTVRDDIGKTGTTSQQVQVGTGAPTASFSISPNPAKQDQRVQVDGSASIGQGGATIVRWEWNFGDPDGADNVMSGSSPTASHVYRRLGTYTITLRVTDSQGRSNTTNQTISIEATDP